jgi:hypothetical protein
MSKQSDKPEHGRQDDDIRLTEAEPVPMRLLELVLRLGRELDKQRGRLDQAQ